jgi:hypothetical protein
MIAIMVLSSLACAAASVAPKAGGLTPLRVYRQDDLKNLMLADVKDNDVIEMRARRITGADLRQWIKRELRVGDPNNPVELAEALRKRYGSESYNLGRCLDGEADVVRVLLGEALFGQTPSDGKHKKNDDDH